LFQKWSAAMSELSSPRRFCAAGTSKKPPQVRKFIRGRRDFRFNRFEHGRKITESGAGSQKGLSANFANRRELNWVGTARCAVRTPQRGVTT
jgi:hypothetical protein